MELFGYRIGKIEKDKKRQERVPSFATPVNEDGAMVVSSGGAFGTYLDMEGTSKTEMQLITKYRELSLDPDGDRAIDDIVNEAIVYEEMESPVSINLDKIKQPVKIKKKITEEFEEILKLLDFQNMSYDIFKKWYVDGRLYYHKMIDVKKPRTGIQELRYIDPRKIRKVKQIIADRGSMAQGVKNEQVDEFFIFNERGLATNTTEGVKIAKDAITFVHSGIINENNTMILSNLHKALKIFTQMIYMEQALVIYRVVRAPERRIFYIDVGNLPKMKAEQHLRDMMVKHKNKLVYDATTGAIRDDRKFSSMMEDFWLTRREGQRGTEVSTLPGGENLNQIDDVLFFKKKFYRALNVPETRMDSETGFTLGRASEITRDELKFSKFVQRLRQRFSQLFDDLLMTQLILKGITDRKTWGDMKEKIFYDFREDNHFTELKEKEILTERMNTLNEVDQYVGRYFSIEQVHKEIFHRTDEDIKVIEDQIKAEKDEPPVTDAGDNKFGAFAGRPDVAEPEDELPPDEGEPESPPPDESGKDPENG